MRFLKIQVISKEIEMNKILLGLVLTLNFLYGNLNDYEEVLDFPSGNACKQIIKEEKNLTSFILLYRNLKTSKQIEYIYIDILKNLYSELSDIRRAREILCSE